MRHYRDRLHVGDAPTRPVRLQWLYPELQLSRWTLLHDWWRVLSRQLRGSTPQVWQPLRRRRALRVRSLPGGLLGPVKVIFEMCENVDTWLAHLSHPTECGSRVTRRSGDTGRGGSGWVGAWRGRTGSLGAKSPHTGKTTTVTDAHHNNTISMRLCESRGIEVAIVSFSGRGFAFNRALLGSWLAPAVPPPADPVPK